MRVSILKIDTENEAQTTKLKNTHLTLEEALFEIEIIKIEQKAVAHQANTYRDHVRKLNRRLLSLYKKRSALEVHVTVGVEKLARKKTREAAAPKTIAKDGAQAFVNSLSQAQVTKLIKEIDRAEGGKANDSKN